MENSAKSIVPTSVPEEIKNEASDESSDEVMESSDDDDLSGESEDEAVATINKIRREHMALAQATSRRGRPPGPRSRMLSQKRKLEAVRTFHDFTKKLKKDTGITIRGLRGGNVLDLGDLLGSESEEEIDTSDGISEEDFEVDPNAVLELNEANESYIDPITGDIVDPQHKITTDTTEKNVPEVQSEIKTLSITDIINDKDLDLSKNVEISEIDSVELKPPDEEMKPGDSTVQDYDITNKLKEMGEISVKQVKKDEPSVQSEPTENVEKKPENEDDKKSANPNAVNVRRNIRDVMDENKLDEATLAAQRQESERLARVQEQQRIIREVQKQIALNKQNKIQQRNLQLLQGSGSSLLKKPGQKFNLSNTVLVKLPSGEVKRIIKPGITGGPVGQKVMVPKMPLTDKKEVVEIVDSSSESASEESSSSSSDSDDCIMLSDSEVPPSPEAEEDPGNSGLHVNDTYNTPDEHGRVVVNIGHPENEEDIFVAPQIARIIKPHQIGGVRFLFDNIIESVERFSTSTGFGCILAHSMGLGKTLQIVTFTDIFLRHTSSKTVLCIMPINTLQNWVAEFNMWLPTDASASPLAVYGEVRPRHFPIYVLNDSHKTLQMRAKVVKEWTTSGGVLMIGYELYRLLSLKKDKKPAAKRGRKKVDLPPSKDITKDSPKTKTEPTNEDTQGSSDNTTQSKPEEIKSEVKPEIVGDQIPAPSTPATPKLEGSVEIKPEGGEQPPIKLEEPKKEEEVDEDKKLLDEMYEALVKPGPDLVICDEGHRIKNSHSNISYALKQMRTKRRVVLTGYPLQNNLLEYWCMVDFVRPNYLGSKAEFSNMFERPIQNGQCIDSTPQDIRLMRYRAHVLHSLLVGFVQRRSHAVLQTSLPQKEEYVLLIRMTPLQRKLYDTFMNEVVRNKSTPNPLKAFAICCKIWNHPDVLYMFLKKRAEANIAVEMDLDLDEVVGAQGRVTRSGKGIPGRKPGRQRGDRRNKKRPAATIQPNTTSSNMTPGQNYPFRPQYDQQNYPYPGYQQPPGYFPPPPNQEGFPGQGYGANYQSYPQYPYNQEQQNYPGYNQQGYWNQEGFYGNNYYNQPNYQGNYPGPPQPYPAAPHTYQAPPTNYPALPPPNPGGQPYQQRPMQNFPGQQNYQGPPHANFPPNNQGNFPPPQLQNQPYQTSPNYQNQPAPNLQVPPQNYPALPQGNQIPQHGIAPNTNVGQPNQVVQQQNYQGQPNIQGSPQPAPFNAPSFQTDTNSQSNDSKQFPFPKQEQNIEQSSFPQGGPQPQVFPSNYTGQPTGAAPFPQQPPYNPTNTFPQPNQPPAQQHYPQQIPSQTQPYPRPNQYQQSYPNGAPYPNYPQGEPNYPNGQQQNTQAVQPYQGFPGQAPTQNSQDPYFRQFPNSTQAPPGFPPPNGQNPQEFPGNNSQYQQNNEPPSNIATLESNYSTFDQQNYPQTNEQFSSTELNNTNPVATHIKTELPEVKVNGESVNDNQTQQTTETNGFSYIETKSPSGSADIPMFLSNSLKTESEPKEEKMEIRSESDSEVKIEDLDTHKTITNDTKATDDTKKEIKSDNEKSEGESFKLDPNKIGKLKKQKGKAKNIKERKSSKDKEDITESESEKEEKKDKEDEAEKAKKAEETYDWAIELLRTYIPGLIENSAKMDLFFTILNESIMLGDRILLFSQSLFTLNLIEDFLERNIIPGTNTYWARNISYFRLDGSTHALEREKLINEFNVNPKVYLFLVSTRAGSLGINLVGANRVIVFDASWNPCHDTQAVCRVYRYGQQKPCFVYRFVMDCCLEKKIYDRQINKQGMADRVVDECNPDAILSMKEITNLCWDADEKECEAKDLSDTKDKYMDPIMQIIVDKHWKILSKEPFHHESLLVDRKEKKLSSAEKRLAQRGYELEKKAATAPKPVMGGRARPVGTVRPMQHAARWIPAEVWRRQGMTAQEMTLPLDVVIPTNSAEKTNIVLKAGQRVMVLKSPKGIYMQLESGKIIAIKTSLKVGQKPGEKDPPPVKKVMGVRPQMANIPGALKNNTAITVTQKSGIRQAGFQRLQPRPGMQGRFNIRPNFNPRGVRPIMQGKGFLFRNKTPVNFRAIRPNLPIRKDTDGISAQTEEKSDPETHILDSDDETPNENKEENKEKVLQEPQTVVDDMVPVITPEKVHEDSTPIGDLTQPIQISTATIDKHEPKPLAHAKEESISLIADEKFPIETTIEPEKPAGKSLLSSLKNYRHPRSFAKPPSTALTQLERAASASTENFRRDLDDITAVELEKPGPKSRKKRLPIAQTASVPPLSHPIPPFNQTLPEQLLPPYKPNVGLPVPGSGIPTLNPGQSHLNHPINSTMVPNIPPMNPSVPPMMHTNMGPSYSSYGTMGHPYPPQGFYGNHPGPFPYPGPPAQPTKFPPDNQFPPENPPPQW